MYVSTAANLYHEVKLFLSLHHWSPLNHQFLNTVLCSVLVAPWTAAHQASLPFTISRSLLKLMSIVLVMPSNHLFLSHPLLLLPSVFPSIRVFSNESALSIRWLQTWSFSFSFSISPSTRGPSVNRRQCGIVARLFRVLALGWTPAPTSSVLSLSFCMC